MSAMLSVRNIRKTFGDVRAVDGVSFDVRQGSITGLLGRNGAGKTTTIRMITRIFHPDEGTIEWHGGGDPEEAFRNRIGYLPEERGLYKDMKLLDTVLFLAEIKNRTGADVRKRAEEWLERFELADKKDGKVEELSKGNQQKIQLIGAILADPDLIILDEPMSGFDPVNVVLVRNIVRELRDQGKTILLSTHMMAEAEKLADEIVLIHDGRVVLSGDLASVKSSSERNHVHMEFDGRGEFISELPAVEHATIHGSSAEITLDPEADSEEFLRQLLGRVKLRKFEIASPSLEEIFIEKVGGETIRRDEDVERERLAEGIVA